MNAQAPSPANTLPLRGPAVPATPPPLPRDVFCTVERHPGLARPQGAVMSLAG
jgi:hypothetical protein